MRPISLLGGGARVGGGSRDGGAGRDNTLNSVKPTLGKPRYYAPSRKLVHDDDGFNALSRLASSRSASAIGARRDSHSRSSAVKHPWVSEEMHGPSAPPPTWNEQRAAFGQLPAPMALHPSLQQRLDSNSMGGSRSVPPLAPRPTARRGTRKTAADSFTRLEPLVWLG